MQKATLGIQSGLFLYMSPRCIYTRHFVTSVMDKEYQPAECISTRLHRLSRLVDDIYRKHLLEYGISESQMGILLFLSDSGPISQAALGKALHLQRSTVTRNLQRMVVAGQIDKSGSAMRPQLSLTRKGKSLVRKILPAWNKAMNEVASLAGSSGMAAVGIMERRLLEENG